MRHWHYNSKPIERKKYFIDPVSLGIMALVGGGVAGGMALGGGDDEENQLQAPQIDLPNWWEDPYVGKTQESLFPFYSDIMAGRPNEYYAPIGRWGGQELEDIIGLTRRDITGAVTEDLARRNISGGVGGDIIARTMADVTPKLRWQDYSRALTGRLNLLNIGRTGMENVRSAALSNQGQRNQFNLGRSELELRNLGLGLEADKFNILQDTAQNQAEAALWGDILGSGVSAATNIYGYNMLKDIFGGSKAQEGITSNIGGIDLDQGLRDLLKIRSSEDFYKLS